MNIAPQRDECTAAVAWCCCCGSAFTLLQRIDLFTNQVTVCGCTVIIN